MLHIILINYNSSEDTINCIQSIQKSNEEILNCRICIIDNGSTDIEQKKLKNFCDSFTKSSHTDLEVFFSGRNAGFAAANNYWLKKIPENDYVWILNNDTLVNKPLLQVISKNLPSENEVCYMECRTFEGAFHDNGLHYTSLLTGRNSMTRKSSVDLEYICGASLIAKKTPALPLWDERYFLYYEDLDYELLLKKNGFVHKKLENCYFQHKIGASSKKEKTYNSITLRSQVLFMKRNGLSYLFYFVAKTIHILLRIRSIKVLKDFFKFTFTVKKDSFFESAKL